MRYGRRNVLLLAVVVPLIASCEGRITDPAGDGLNVDAVEAGIDYRTDRTRLWIRLEQDGGGVAHAWDVSTNGDTTAEVRVRLGDPGAGTGGGGDHYSVQQWGSDGTVVCAGYAPNVGPLIEVTIDSRCLSSNPFDVHGDPRLPDDLRFIASSSAHRVAFDEFSAWSAPIPRS